MEEKTKRAFQAGYNAGKKRDELVHGAYQEGLTAGIEAVSRAISTYAAEHRKKFTPELTLVPDHLPQPIDALIDDLRKVREGLEASYTHVGYPGMPPAVMQGLLDAIGHAEDRAGEVWHELRGTGDRQDWERGTERGTEGGFDAF